MDEPPSTLDKRIPFVAPAADGPQYEALPNSEANRASYRDLLFSAPGLSDYVSGVILHEETLFQDTPAGGSFVQQLGTAGIIPGIKVDRAFLPMMQPTHAALLGGVKETVTQGLDDLGARCDKFYAQGARFAKWRAVLHVSPSTPSEVALVQNCQGLARYASICQEHGLMPIVEPDVVMDGDHSLAVSALVTKRVMAHTFEALSMHGVDLEGILIKTNMVRPGASNGDAVAQSPAAIALATVRVLQETMPPSVPGCMFLSGGMSEDAATESLLEMNKLRTSNPALGQRMPWALSFSFGRALQHSARVTWLGDDANRAKAQAALVARARMNGLAALGQDADAADKKTAGAGGSASLHVAGGNMY